MPMTQRERILAVFRGQTPDVVPFMLDLSHWFYHKHSLPWDLSVAYEAPEEPLIAYHRANGVGFYIPNLAPFYQTRYAADVQATSEKLTVRGLPAITWRLCTPLGTLERTRVWEPASYSWGIRDWGVKTEQDLRILGYAMGAREFDSDWHVYRDWADCVGDCGVLYLSLGYSAMGYLLSLWMGIEGTMYALCDWPDTMAEVVEQINAANLRLVDLAAQSPAEVVIMGDNFSTDIQSPRFFAEWSAPYYEEAIRRLHAAGKCAALHIDGRLQGGLRMLAQVGADCADAVTPPPMGDLDAAACRAEAGPELILSGGVSPDLWLPQADVKRFEEAVTDWLATKTVSPRLIANAGDQVPPGAEEARIGLMRELVEQYGRY